MHPEYNIILNTSAATSGLLAAYGQEGVDETDLYLSVALDDPEYLESFEGFLDEKIEGEDLTIREKFDADFLEMAKYGDGNHYALPYIGGGVYGLVYNKDIFKEYSIEIPRTTNELVVVADALSTEGLPAFCSFQGTGYWKYALEVWYAQYEGQDYYYKNFYACKDENGTTPSKEVLLKKDGRYAVLKAAESLFTPNYVLSGSNSATHTVMQTQFLNGEAVMMFNGSWLENEMKSVGGMEKFDIMRLPVLSEITEKLTTVKNEAQLRKVITAIDTVLDGNKKEDDYKSGEDYVVDGLNVSAADWKHVYEARTMAAGGYIDNSAFIPKYSTAKDAAKDFLKFLYSDEGLQLMGDQTGTRLPLNMCEGKLDISDWSPFLTKYDEMATSSIRISSQSTWTHPIFTMGGASLYAGIEFIPHFCTQNASDRWTAEDTWNQVIQKVNDNYLPNWLANIK